MILENYTLPEYWAGALINGDYSGLNDNDIIEIEKFFNEKRTAGCRLWCIDADFDTLQFKWSNDANHLGGNVIDYTFDVSPI